MGFLKTNEEVGETVVFDTLGSEDIKDGSLHFTAEGGENSNKLTIQEASGAPVEQHSPLGYSVGWVTVVFLNVSMMVGTGVFSTPSAILSGTGSIGLSMFYWFIGYLLAYSTLSVYLEFAAYFPSRSGSEVVYLEQSFPRPRYLFPTVFAIQTVLFSFSSSNAIVIAEYLFHVAGTTPTAWQQKGVAVAAYTLAVLLVIFHTRYSLLISNAIGAVKLITLIFIGITGLVVLGGNTSIKTPTANFKNAFSGTSDATVYGATNALIDIIFSYQGYTNAFNVVNEVKNPIKTLRWSAPLSLTLTAVLYILANIAYFTCATKEEIKNSKQVVAGLFFEKVFGTGGASKALNLLICLSAFGNLIAVLIGQSRVLRECGRQGVLPWTNFWTSTRPFGTPIGPYAVKWVLTIVMILAPPAGDAFNFIVDLSIYPSNLFSFILTIGLIITRRRRQHLKLGRPEYRCWDVAVGFSVLTGLYILIMPWVPPPTGADGGNVSFWYATYIVTGLAIIGACVVYYYVWVWLIPKWGNYQLRQTILHDDNGTTAHNLVKVPNEEVESWDLKYDIAGRLRQRPETTFLDSETTKG
ncbi:uncharacterized protein N7482_005556 [Penicillium canariense]|uniref:High affinity methionine permease n=1 Tax=Penicillium canariense TaxID=189055 RepID=A0A9W9I533_9EURO|nr:uncharacterized protein N7482_005556 [Penicillium canariense]KAJ5166775.1 hypothetical protein N7482_005556 [Penicillium canariense]